MKIKLGKILKALKKLKFWSSKKKKKGKAGDSHYHPSICHHYCSCPLLQPSAPPLPSWLDESRVNEPIAANGVGPVPRSPYPGQVRLPSERADPEISPLYPTLPVSNSSYQQYMDPNPVYVVALLPNVRRENGGGVFRCVASVGAHLIRCLCPCL